MGRVVRSAALLLGVLVGGGCADNPVGRKCFVGDVDGSTSFANIISSPALECPSNTCLHVRNHEPDLCTGECGSADDCDKVKESPCKGGFSCVIPFEAGPFCCKRMCVCNDYLPQLDGGVPPPAACDPDNAFNECCNLPGRRDRLEACK